MKKRMFLTVVFCFFAHQFSFAGQVHPDKASVSKDAQTDEKKDHNDDSLSRLNKDQLQEIAKHLNPKDYARLSGASKELNDTLTEEDFINQHRSMQNADFGEVISFEKLFIEDSKEPVHFEPHSMSCAQNNPSGYSTLNHIKEALTPTGKHFSKTYSSDALNVSFDSPEEFDAFLSSEKSKDLKKLEVSFNFPEKADKISEETFKKIEKLGNLTHAHSTLKCN
jgi:hypothetical protein